MAATLKLIASPHTRSNGTTHPNLFDAHLDGRLVCTSNTPLLDSARALLKVGIVQPDDLLEMWHAGSGFFSVRGNVGRLAKLTIEETGSGPRLRKYKPHPGVGVLVRSRIA